MCTYIYDINVSIFCQQNKVQVKEVKFKKDYLNDEDVFLIDLGLKIYQVYLIIKISYMYASEKKAIPTITIILLFCFSGMVIAVTRMSGLKEGNMPTD